MKSAVLTDVKKIVIEETETPGAGRGEAVVEVRACGVCGTDVHIFEGDKGAADNPLPIILGHEFSGIVTETGPGVTNVAKGDRVCVDPNALCGGCDFCRNGTGHFCEYMIGIGTTVNGGFSEYCRVPASQLYKLADTTTFEEGAMSEPLACCLHGIDLCEIKAGDTVAVIGGGMIGQLMVQLAAISGAADVILIEPVAAKRELALKLGANLCVDPLSENADEFLAARTIKNVHVVIECVGNPRTIQQAISIAGKKSTVMMFGLTKPEETIEVKPYEIFKKEITLKASFINPYTMGRAVQLINSRRIDVASVIAGTAPLSELAGILSSAEMRKSGKYIINPHK